ncbi:LiaI-LiaF-like domain-containing protein [Massilia consociata]|uniref:LiaI-LiaF-like domain-containing protein n=1 Tax=Massilia consociata TaxID=760117 RepID=A0ABV6FG07_9BURK
MHTEEAYRWRKQVIWGLLLIVVGTVFLLDRLGHIDASETWHYWPLLLVVVGINQTIGYPSPREFGNGLWTVFIGLWLFACLENVFGLTFFNSWPLFILAWGVNMVVQPLVARRLSQQPSTNNPESQHEK